MLIVKRNKDNRCETIKFNEFVNDLELTEKKKQNRVCLNYRLLNHENIFVNDFTYFLKLS